MVVSGALTLQAGMRLVTGRASIIQKFWGEDTGSMIAIEANLAGAAMTPAEFVESFYREIPEAKVDIACYNEPNCFVVAGSTVDIGRLEIYLKDKKAEHANLRFKVLKGVHAYHSVLANSIINEGADLSASIQFQDPNLPFESCHEGPWAVPGINTIARNTCQPVYFAQAISRIVDRLGTCVFLESGFGGPIAAMASKALPQIHASDSHTFVALNGKDPVRSLADATVTLWKSGQQDVQFWPFHRS